MKDRIRVEGSRRALVGCLLLCLAVLLVAGCSATTGPSSQYKMPGAGSTGATTGAKMASNAAPTSKKMGAPDPNAQMCLSCSKGEKPAAASGTVVTSGGKQIANVSIKDGTYTPNHFVAKAGTPLSVVFTVDGKPAKGCLSKPTFKSLNKSLEVTSGVKNIDLGALAPGTYTFTCAMGMNPGQIVVR